MARAASFNLVMDEYGTNSIHHAVIRGQLTQKDAELITTFTSELQATVGISVSRSNKLIYTLVGWRRFIKKPFNECTIADIHKAIPELKKGTSTRAKPYKANTISDFLKVLKQFYTWMSKYKLSKIPLERIRDIKAPGRDNMTTVANDLLTPDEVEQMVRACKRDVDRALIMTTYEGGFRIGEMGQLRWGDLSFDTFGIVANVNFKTQKPRYVRLVMAQEYIARWRAGYPGNPEGNALVFVNRNGEPLTHAQVRLQFRRIADRAGITKRVNPHIFRHSRITHLIQQGAAESVVKAVMWGSQDSRMLKTYLHLTGQDVDKEMLRLYGIETPKKKTERGLKPIQCPHCQIVNSPLNTFCSSCGRGLTTEAETEVEEARRFAQSPAKLRLLADILEQEQKQGVMV